MAGIGAREADEARLARPLERLDRRLPLPALGPFQRLIAVVGADPATQEHLHEVGLVLAECQASCAINSRGVHGWSMVTRKISLRTWDSAGIHLGDGGCRSVAVGRVDAAFPEGVSEARQTVPAGAHPCPQRQDRHVHVRLAEETPGHRRLRRRDGSGMALRGHSQGRGSRRGAGSEEAAPVGAARVIEEGQAAHEQTASDCSSCARRASGKISSR